MYILVYTYMYMYVSQLVMRGTIHVHVCIHVYRGFDVLIFYSYLLNI